jgi:microcin C transport system substrate-binding protein
MQGETMRIAVFIGLFAFLLAGAGMAQPQQQILTTHALSLHGQPKYSPDFKHFDYVNPDAPKGGELRNYAVGTYDTLNPFTLKGVAAAGIGYLFDTLMTASADEPYSEYGLLAESVQVPADNSWALFTLRKEARWHDGRPVTADDVVFTFEILKTRGHPQYRFYYANVRQALKIGPRQVKFIFSEGQNRELPHIIGQLVVLPKHYWQDRDFSQTTLEEPLGSGPYRIAAKDPGRWITYERDSQYWGRDLPVNRGSYNFERIRFDYYRDTTVALQAFLAGQYDFRLENVAKDWATAYNTPAVRDGLIVKEEIPHSRPQGMQGFVYNIRKPIFQDPRVRHSLAYAFDFEWSNANLFYGQYTRTKSYFANSELAAVDLPGPQELAVLEPLKGQIPDEVFTQVYEPPVTDGTGQIRQQLKQAFQLLVQAGWSIENGKLVNQQTRQPFAFEILLNSPTWERITLPFIKNLERLGIAARLRTVDSAQYQQRIEDFDFDMVVDVFPQSSSPGNEQREFWGSAAADQPGSRNTIGIKNPAVDRLIDRVIAAPDRGSLVARTRALDRVLLWGHYVIPHWHLRYFRVAYWAKLKRPAVTPAYDLPLNTWWVDPEKASIILKSKKPEMRSQ